MAKFGWHLSNLVAFIRLNLFVKIGLQQWLDKPFKETKDPPENHLQRVLFENRKLSLIYPTISPVLTFK